MCLLSTFVDECCVSLLLLMLLNLLMILDLLRMLDLFLMLTLLLILDLLLMLADIVTDNVLALLMLFLGCLHACCMLFPQ